MAKGPQASSLAEALKVLRRTTPSSFAPPDAARAEAYSSWLTHLSRAATQGQLPSQAPAPGFAGTFVDQGRVWLLSEEAGFNTGAGAVALRASSRRPLIVEAPHTFFDSKTLPIAISLFETARAQALLINTMHRGGAGDDEARVQRIRAGSSAADVAHADSSYFQVSHDVFSRTSPDAVVVQLHGFRDEKVPRVQIIVSAAGTQADTAPLARALNDALGPGTARRYPEEVKQLGGTQNVQARASRSLGGKFYHLEISASLRARLAKERSLREDFSQAIVGGLELQ